MKSTNTLVPLVPSVPTARSVDDHRLINVQDVPWEASLWEEFCEQMMQDYATEVSQLRVVESPRVKATFLGFVWNAEHFLDECFGKEAYPMVRRMLSYEYGDVTIRYDPTFVCKADPNIYCRATRFREMDEFRFDPLSRAVADDFDNKLDVELRCLRKRGIEAFMSFERDLSAQLGKLYDELTSDEAVWATLCGQEIEEILV